MFLLTYSANIFCLIVTLLIFKKVRYWRDDDGVQAAKKKEGRKSVAMRVIAKQGKNNQAMLTKDTKRISKSMTMNASIKSMNSLVDIINSDK